MLLALYIIHLGQQTNSYIEHTVESHFKQVFLEFTHSMIFPNIYIFVFTTTLDARGLTLVH